MSTSIWMPQAVSVNGNWQKVAKGVDFPHNAYAPFGAVLYSRVAPAYAKASAGRQWQSKEVLFPGSSMAEQHTVNVRVVGSNPTLGALMEYKLRSKVWMYPGAAAWYFVNVNKKVSREIKETFGESERGFGSIRVVVTVGHTSWKTSIFPDSKSGTYLLPIKADVRKKEGIREGMMLSYAIKIQP